ncbi:H-NS family nucleoid-associated regulatory protein, partial [uncultured Jannaschia sp.]|uniref:H-NS histone family protein n=1 Tax=uncultured Jannaschia sp. TaxID=293347 RepID=UPI00345C2D37
MQLADGSGKSTKKTKAPQPAKYRHSENASLTWSGRGRQPGWIKGALENGRSLDTFLIDKNNLYRQYSKTTTSCRCAVSVRCDCSDGEPLLSIMSMIDNGHL